MKPIVYPVELFYWHKQDAQGNTCIEIRDKNHVTVFKMSIVGREYFEEKRLVEELGPMVVGLMNLANDLGLDGIKTAVMNVGVARAKMDAEREQNVPQNVQDSSTNGHDKGLKNVTENVQPKRRGNPNWIKGRKK